MEILSQPGVHESLAEARADIVEGRTFSEERMRDEFGKPKRVR